MKIICFLETLDELQSIVIKSFKDVPNKKLKKPKYLSDPYGENKRKVSFFIKQIFHLLFM
jgi:secreted Zn-dependent insulinase-like peptidase